MRRANVLFGGVVVSLAVGCGSKADGSGGASTDGAPATEDGPIQVVNNYVFVTSRDYTGQLGGLDGADEKCNMLAAAAGLPGTYKAWLSTSSVDARDRLQGARGWIRTDGLPFADSVADLVAGKIFYPVALDEYGRDTRSLQQTVWTGSDSSGARGSAACGDWTTTGAPGGTWSGSSAAADRTWTQQIAVGCSARGHLYCFGIDRATPLSFTPATGRMAFLLPGVKPGSGLVALDQACQQAATAAGFVGSFGALVATSQASAPSRFNSNGATWVRPDGVMLAKAAGDFLRGDTLAGLNVSAHLTYSPFAYVFTGIDKWDREGDPTCQDWASQAGYGWAGMAGVSDMRSFHAASLECNTTANLYCLEL